MSKKLWIALIPLTVAAAAAVLYINRDTNDAPGGKARGKPLEASGGPSELDRMERDLRAAIAKRPNDARPRIELVSLLTAQCRTYEAIEQTGVLLRTGGWQIDDILLLAAPEDLFDAPELDDWRAREPDHARLLVAKARLAIMANDFDAAKRWIDRAMQADPELADAHAVLGIWLLERDPSDKALTAWANALPEDAGSHPDNWWIQGMLARQRKDPDGAARCFAEALQIFPNHRQATHQLSLVLAELGEEKRAQQLSERVKQLDLLSRSVNDVYTRPGWDVPWLAMAPLFESLGRLPEAAATYQAIVAQGFGGEAEKQRAIRMASYLSMKTPMVSVEQHPLADLDIEQYALPDFDAAGAGEVETERGAADIQWVDVAADVGVNFSYYGAEKPPRHVRHIYYLLGGGLGAFDYDLNGWPDLYCAQAAPRAPAGGSDFRDTLFRNISGQFEDVGALAGLGDPGISHGVGVGDFNNDGFPDMMVANAGPNRLYQNNGDGTFTDVTRQAGLVGDVWTSSCVIADLNGDSLPDLYEVNYLGGPKIPTTMCLGGVDCPPVDFPGVPDRFYLNLGDGRFDDQTEQAGFVGKDGKGLGVVVADFDGDGRPSVFVTNDSTANHLYDNEAPRGEAPRFRERGTLAGVAYSAEGFSQGCMGIAIDDINRDGLLDLFVTNFSGEPNALYVDQTRQLYQDDTRAAQLRLPSLPMVGFGTEFIDVDLDGDPDLVVSNGNITDVVGQPYEFQMQAQFFENRNGRFFQRPGSAVGSYFDRKLVGRCLTRLDFDRDGREDCAVSHLDAPVALLRNETTGGGHYLAIRLRGITCDRDAVGSILTLVDSKGRRRVRHLTAGDGYECVNEPQLIFGMGDAATVAELTVRWPTGREQTFRDLAADSHLLLIEGSDEPLIEHLGSGGNEPDPPNAR